MGVIVICFFFDLSLTFLVANCFHVGFSRGFDLEPNKHVCDQALRGGVREVLSVFASRTRQNWPSSWANIVMSSIFDSTLTFLVAVCFHLGYSLGFALEQSEHICDQAL